MTNYKQEFLKKSRQKVKRLSCVGSFKSVGSFKYTERLSKKSLKLVIYRCSFRSMLRKRFPIKMMFFCRTLLLQKDCVFFVPKS